MTSRLDRLERARLVTRTPDPNDGRAVRVQLTGEGETLAERSLDAVLAVDETFWSRSRNPNVTWSRQR